MCTARLADASQKGYFLAYVRFLPLRIGMSLDFSNHYQNPTLAKSPLFAKNKQAKRTLPLPNKQISCSLQYSSLVHRLLPQWYHIVLLIDSIVVFMTTPRDQFIKVLSKKSSVKTLFFNRRLFRRTSFNSSSESPSCSSSLASHSTTSSPSRVFHH